MGHKMWHVGKVAVVLVGAAVLGALVMVLWNVVVPGLFAGSHPIDYWHALGLLVLSRILFGGFGGHRGWHGRHHLHKLAGMTPEEREAFMKDRVGRWHTHKRDRL